MVNETIIPLVGGIQTTVTAAWSLVQWAFGGLFGLYLVLVILRWRESREVRIQLTQINEQLQKLNSIVLRIENIEEKRVKKSKK